jgi:hypothetical protein
MLRFSSFLLHFDSFMSGRITIYSTNEQQEGSTSRKRVLADENEMEEDEIKEAPEGLAKEAPEGLAEGSRSLQDEFEMEEEVPEGLADRCARP